MKSILLMDSEKIGMTALAKGLTQAGYVVKTAESVDEALTKLQSDELPDLVILEACMPGRNGLELATRLEELGNIPFIVLTNSDDKKIIEQASFLGAMGYLIKPVVVSQLIPEIETVLSRAYGLQSLRKSEQSLQNALKNDKAVSLAVGILMDQHRLSAKAASEMLRKSARDQNLKLIALASNIVDSRETLNMGK